MENGAVFSFCTRHGVTPPVNERREIYTDLKNEYRLTLIVRIKHATINNLSVVNEARTADYDGDPVSTVCGRAVLELEEWKIIPFQRYGSTITTPSYFHGPG